MARHLHRFGTLTIASGQTQSQAYAVQSALGSLIDLLVFAPATLPETVRVQVAPIAAPQAADWKDLQVGVPGANMTIAAGVAQMVPAGGMAAIRLVSGVAVAADRVFTLNAQMDATGIGEG